MNDLLLTIQNNKIVSEESIDIISFRQGIWQDNIKHRGR